MTYEPEPLQWQMVLRGVGVILILIGIGMLIMDASNVKELESQILQKNTALSNKQSTTKNVTANSGTGKSNQTPATPSKGTVDPIIVLDQFGHPVPQAKVWLVDKEARIIPEKQAYWGISGWETDSNGRIRFTYTPQGTGSIPDGTYTIHIEKQNYTTVESLITLTTDDSQKYSAFSPHTFTMPKQGIITAVIVDEAGKPATYASYKLISADGKMMGNGYPIETGRIESAPIPDGQYNLQVHMTSYDNATGRNTEYESERSVTMTGGTNMFLGNITLVKKQQ